MNDSRKMVKIGIRDESGQVETLWATHLGENTYRDEELRWAIEHASSAVREIVRRMQVRRPGRSRLDALLYQLDAGLRH